MTKREKRLLRLRQNPTNVSLDELQQVLESEGFTLDHVSGSHHIFRCAVSGQIFRVVVPFARPVKSLYVKQALATIDEIRALRSSDPREESEADD